MSDAVILTQEGSVATLTLNEPEARNALSDAIIDGLVAACRRLERDASVRAVIVTGAGKAFSAGGNVKQMRDRTGLFGGTPAETRNGYRYGIQQIPLALYELEVPTIAAINGGAIGAGLDLSLMCDMRIAAEDSVFAESFVKLGIIPGDGGAWLLPRAIGLARASELAFTGDRIDAPTALSWGLVSRVVAPDRLMAEARTLALRVAANPPEILRMTKRLIREGQRLELRSLLELSAAMQAIAQTTADHREAVAAFFDKREPNYRGD